MYNNGQYILIWLLRNCRKWSCNGQLYVNAPVISLIVDLEFTIYRPFYQPLHVITLGIAANTPVLANINAFTTYSCVAGLSDCSQWIITGSHGEGRFVIAK